MKLKLNNNIKKVLFLDRDGVINIKLDNDYVKKWDEFIFINGALEALKKLSIYFDIIIIVTNQQGIGKGLMIENDLKIIHSKMLSKLFKAGVYINKIYYSSDLKTKIGNTRKPNIAMGLKAKIDFPDINFSNSIMIGDSDSDIEFGKRLGMTCIKITQNLSENGKQDYNFLSISDFSKKIFI